MRAGAATCERPVEGSGCMPWTCSSNRDRVGASTFGGRTMTETPTEAVTFATDIKPLFRESDRTAMKGAFDLWSYEDVRAHADAIASHLRDGSMPCDGPWPFPRVALYERWLADGAPA